MEINPEDYDDYEEGSVTPPKKSRRKSSKSQGVQRRIEKNEYKLKRAEESLKMIEKRLSNFPDVSTDHGKKQREIYAAWVEKSLANQASILSHEDVKYILTTSSVKAGGQHRQKNMTSVRAVHFPTQLSVTNEDERSLDQNKRRAIQALYPKLEHHLNLWKTALSASPYLNIRSEVQKLSEKKHPNTSV